MALEPTLKMESNSKVAVEVNWNIFKALLKSTKREGIDKLIEYLEDRTDFKTAPASTKFHLNSVGGLCQHTLNVARFADTLQTELEVPDINPSSLSLVALLHDLCKANYYSIEEVFDKEYKNETNRWRKMEVWGVDDKVPLGHGEKSAILAVRYLALSVNELTAIRWHMGWSDQGVHSFYPSGAPFKEALNTNPLLKLLMLADNAAELYEGYAYD